MEVKPRELDEVLVNPGIGFETGGCFNGDRKVRNYPVCSIAYFRFYWDRLEPEEGRYAFDLIEQLLTKARECGQDLACGSCRWIPIPNRRWFRAKEKGFTYQVKAAGWERGLKKGQMVESWAPDFNSPVFLERQEALVRAWRAIQWPPRPGADGHRQYRSLGRMAHFRYSGADADRGTRCMIDWYFQYWGRTPLTMLVRYTPGLRHAVRRGAGCARTRWATGGISRIAGATWSMRIRNWLPPAARRGLETRPRHLRATRLDGGPRTLCAEQGRRLRSAMWDQALAWGRVQLP